MSELADYRRKRDFAHTPEPEGDAETRGRDEARKGDQGGVFVVHKHAARALHYDLRLEMDGALKSWAVPKGPSYDPGQKRLAVHVEDHPLDYAGFEGTIPKGEYGGGTVMLWDEGRWTAIGDAEAGYRRGELKVQLHGKKLSGAWVLVHTGAHRPDDEDKRWLLIKERDGSARRGAPDQWSDADRSVKSGRTMAEIAAGEQPRSARQPAGRAAKLPAFCPPQLCTLVEQPPLGDEWLHEIKYDGYRLLARVKDGRARLFTRRAADWTERFAGLAPALAELPLESAWLDGEAVVFEPDGSTSFEGLQQALSGGPGSIEYLAFDLLYLDGRDLREEPLIERKALLDEILSEAAPPLRYVEHLQGSGADFRTAACDYRLEGVVSKRADSRYVGRRSTTWRKCKCGRRQEVVVGGYTAPGGARIGFGALLIGVHQGDALRYAGRVGSGFDDRTLGDLTRRLEKLRRADPPFADPPRGAEARGATWVEPELVAEVAFSEWTRDGRLRQPVFKGLRSDKPAGEVRREEPAGDGSAVTPGEPAGDGSAVSARGLGAGDGTGAPGGPPPSDGTGSGGEGGRGDAPPARRRTVDGATRSQAGPPATGGPPELAGVTVTHPDRVVYPDVGMTKLEVVEYYEATAERMLPHLRGRALTLVRCPDGVETTCFFQKHASTSALPKVVGRVTAPEGKGTAEYPMVDDATALLALTQVGVIEFHVGDASLPALEKPDRMIFDLDPAPDVPWESVRAAATALRAELRRRGLESFLKTSGGKGLHVVVPLAGTEEFPAVAAFSREVAEAMVAAEPGVYTATMSKAKRGGKTFIDHFRNGRGATAVAPYSLRARPGAPVSLPLRWDELPALESGAEWTAGRVLRRLRAQKRDPWTGLAATGARQTLPR